ncbi:NADH-quinone oxidoreductase subunit NuoE family protein, partial [Clostridioides difficile]
MTDTEEIINKYSDTDSIVKPIITPRFIPSCTSELLKGLGDLLHVARKLGVAPAKVYGVVTFYSYFTTEPVGKYKISVCLGTVC